MAQKANPYAIRLGYNQLWNNYFFPEKKGKSENWIKMDSSIRNYFGSLFSDVVKLKIEYLRDEVFVYLYISGLETFLSENGGNIEKISKDLSKKIGSEKYYFRINIIEVKNSYSRAQSVANLISSQLKKRMRSRMVIKNIISRMSSERDVKGIKIEVSGRLDESDISQTRKEVWGKMPLSTIDSNIEIGSSEAVTSYGKIGIKVLIYKGKIWQKKNTHANTQENQV